MSDRLLQSWVSLSIERARRRYARGDSERWHPGRPLRLLFAGYNGARNTGADARVQEMLRQVRHVLGAERTELSVLTQNFERSRGYFEDATQVRLPDVFPPFLAREVPKYDGVIACEGSMFKSRFADALTTMMIGALGLAAARNGLSVGYGAEAGAMSAPLERMVQRYCNSSLVITRNEESGQVLRRLKVPVEPGTDTAWTFEPAPPEQAQAALKALGWDGHTPILAICPIHPFWWPVRASLGKALMTVTTGAYRESRYRSIYYHHAGAEVDAAFTRYVEAISRAVLAFRKEHSVFPVVVATERLDRVACDRIAEQLGGVPIVTSDDYDMFLLVAMLRQARMMVSSRYHGIVTAMPAGVPSAGITMDERIRNLMADRGHEDLLMEVDDPDLEDRLYDALHVLWNDGEVIRSGIERCVVRNLKRMARMGRFLEEEVERCYPDFPTRSGLVPWTDYLPPLNRELAELIVRHDSSTDPLFPLSPAATSLHKEGMSG